MLTCYNRSSRALTLVFCDHSELMGTMGFSQDEVKRALEGQKYNQVTAVYLLLGRKASEVCSLPQLLQGFDGHQIHQIHLSH